MTYEKQNWVDSDPSTPLSAARLGHIEEGIAGVDATAQAAKTAAEKPVTWDAVKGKPTIPTVPSVMTVEVAEAGTATSAATISAAVLKAGVAKHSPTVPGILSAADAQAGTATAARTISAKVFADEVQRRVAAAVDPLVARIAALETKVAALESPAGE